MDPFVTAASDYHDFPDVLRHFKNAGWNLTYEEVGCGRSDLWGGPRGGYHAVFYEKGKREDAIPLIKEWKMILNEDPEEDK